MKTKLLLIVAIFFGISINAQNVTITGTGTGGWNQPGNLVLNSTDGIVWTASNFEIVGDGNMKFSEGGTWETTGGFSAGTTAPGFPSGTVTINGGSNIVGTLGFWNVTYNKTSKEYLFTPGVNPNPVIKISGGGLATDIQMNTSNGIAYSKKSVFFPGGDASFKQISPVTAQWGGAFPDGPAVSGGTIPVPTGAFNTYFVMPGVGPAEYVFEPIVFSMIGNFEGSGWNTDLDMETTDNVTYTKSNWAPVVNPTWTDTELHLKFRDNHDWTFQFGCGVDANGGNNLALTGTAKNGINGGGGDIFVPWPTGGDSYNVSFNRSTGAWAFTSTLATTTFVVSTYNVSPNPTITNWNFTSKNNSLIKSIQIIDVLGKIVSSTNRVSNEISVDASNLNSGIYFAKITSDTASETVKLVRN